MDVYLIKICYNLNGDIMGFFNKIRNMFQTTEKKEIKDEVLENNIINNEEEI